VTEGYPDLQALVAEHGSFAAIPPEAWRRHDDAVREWHRRYRHGLPVPPDRSENR
jgi:hypothetical protein